MNWIARLLSAGRSRKIVIVRREVSRVRLEEWRTEPGLVKLASKFLSDPDFLMILDVLRNEHLANFVLPLDASMEVRAILQARIEGYGTALSNLEALARLSDTLEPLEATYEAPELESPNTQT